MDLVCWPSSRYRHLFEALDEPVLIGDKQGRFVDANQAACSLLGYSVDELRHMTVTDLIPRGRRWTAAAYAPQPPQKRWIGSVKVCRKDGTALSLRASARVLTLPSGEPAYVSVLTPQPTRIRH